MSTMDSQETSGSLAKAESVTREKRTGSEEPGVGVGGS